MEYAIVLVKPPSFCRVGVDSQVVEMIKAIGLEIAGDQTIRVSQEQAEQLYSQHKEEDYYPWLISQITSGKARVFLVSGENVAQKVRDLAGPTKPEKARIEAPNSIRARLTPLWESCEYSRQEKRAVDNVVHTSNPDEEGAVQKEGAIFFPQVFN